MPTINFFLRSNNDRANSKVLYVRVSINGTTAEFSTREKIAAEYWNQDSQCYKSRNKQESAYVSTMCDSIKYKLKAAALITEGLTARQLIDRLSAQQPQTSNRAVSELVRMYIDDVREYRAAGTLKNHEIKLANLLSYEKHLGRNLTPETFDLPEAERFKAWFKKKNRTRNVTTASRNVLFYRTALQWSVRNGFIKTFELSLFEGEKDAAKPIMYLTHEELLKVISHQFKSKLLGHVKDLYLFQASTGLSYGDIWSAWKIKDTPDGRVLYGNRQKRTGKHAEGQTYFVPLDNLAFVILDKYENNLPRINNGTYNRILKELAEVIQIDKPLTTHSGRKTFATLMDQDGWSIESIAKMLGHKSIRTTETYYIANSSKRIEREMSERRRADTA